MDRSSALAPSLASSPAPSPSPSPAPPSPSSPSPSSPAAPGRSPQASRRGHRSILAALTLGVGALLATTLGSTAAGAAAQALPTKVAGLRRIFVVGCAFSDGEREGGGRTLLDASNAGITTTLAHLHDYVAWESNSTVDLEGYFAGWSNLPKGTQDYHEDGNNWAELMGHCKANALGSISANTAGLPRRESDYAAIVMLFNHDLGFSNQTARIGDSTPTMRLRFDGPNGGWTSEAVWAHELGHAFGLDHSTSPTRFESVVVPAAEYNNPYDVMSGFAESTQTRWNFPLGGVCNGIVAHPKCLLPMSGGGGAYDNVPVELAAFQRYRLGWLSEAETESLGAGTSNRRLMPPTHGAQPLPVQLLKVPYTVNGASYAIEFRRQGLNAYDEGLPAGDHVLVYRIDPDWRAATDFETLGDANLDAVLAPGGTFASPIGPIQVTFNYVELSGGANVTVTVPDALPPTTTAAPSGGTDGAWANGTVAIQLSAVDQPTGSGVAATYTAVDDPSCGPTTLARCQVSSLPLQVGTEGTHDVTYFSVDRAGNAEPAHHLVVRVDRTPPAITSDRPVSSDAWDAGSATVRFTCNDQGTDPARTSGVAVAALPPVVVTTEGRAQQALNQAVCADRAGNTANPIPARYVNVDAHAPITTATVDGTPSAGGWYGAGSPASVTLHGVDALSGVATTELRLDGGAWQPFTAAVPVPEGSHTIGYRSTDLAGNVEPDQVRLVEVDLTAPTVRIAGIADGAVVTLGTVPTPSCSATDAGSGLAGPCAGVLVRPTTASGAGTYGYVATAVDRAGNRTTSRATFTMQYRWNGIRTPRPAARTVRSGARTPIVFELHDSKGHAVTTAGAVLRLNGADVGTFARTPNGYRIEVRPSALGVTSGLLPLEIALDDGTTHPLTLDVRP